MNLFNQRAMIQFYRTMADDFNISHNKCVIDQFDIKQNVQIFIHKKNCSSHDRIMRSLPHLFLSPLARFNGRWSIGKRQKTGQNRIGTEKHRMKSENDLTLTWNRFAVYHALWSVNLWFYDRSLKTVFL